MKGRGDLAVPGTIVMIGQPRSGTNHLCRLMEAVSGLLVHLEVFNDTRLSFYWKLRLEALREVVGIDFDDLDHPGLNNWVRTHPTEIIELLHSEAPPETLALSLKIFRNHLSIPQVDEALAARPDSAFLFIRRRPIDAYISFMKAVGPNIWMKEDTTNILPELEADAFAEWWHSEVAWYRDTLAVVRERGRPHSFISYDRDIVPSEQATLAMLRSRLASIGFPARIRSGIRLKQPVKRVLSVAAKAVGRRSPWDPALGLARQDRNPTTAAKVANWDAFTADLAARHDLQMLDGYAIDGISTGWPGEERDDAAAYRRTALSQR